MQAPRRELPNREEHRQNSKRGAQSARAYTGSKPHLADFHEQEVIKILCKSLNELHCGRWGRSVELASWRLAVCFRKDMLHPTPSTSISLERLPVAAGGNVAGQATDLACASCGAPHRCIGWSIDKECWLVPELHPRSARPGKPGNPSGSSWTSTGNFQLPAPTWS